MKKSATLLERNRENGLLLRNVFEVLDGVSVPCTDFIDRN